MGLLSFRFSYVCFSTIFIFQLIACSPVSSSGYEYLPRLEWKENDDSRLSYGILLLDQSIRNDDHKNVVKAAELLVDIAPNSRPIIDASSWLLLNRAPATAGDILEQAIKRFPDELNLHLLVSESWLEQGNGDDAIKTMLNYVVKHPTSIQAKQELAVFYVKAQKNEEAVALFEQLPPKSFTSFLNYSYAQALNALGKYGAAIKQLRTATRQAPEFVEAWLELGKTYNLEKKHSEAIQVFEHILDQDSANHEVWANIINSYIEADNITGAISFVKSYQTSFSHLFTAASIFIDAKLYKPAKTVLKIINAKHKITEEVSFLMAVVANESDNDSDKAFELLQAISPKNQFYERAVRFKLSILVGQKKIPEALELLDNNRKFFATEPTFYLMKAELFYKLKRLSDALDILNAGLKQWENDPNLLYSKGVALQLSGNNAEAIMVMEKILEQDAENAQVLNFIGYSLTEQDKDLQLALQLLSKANKIQPDSVHILDSLAWVNFKLGNLNTALELIEKALKNQEESEPVMWEHYGDIAQALGKNKKAITAYRKALIGHEEPKRVQNKMEKLK